MVLLDTVVARVRRDGFAHVGPDETGPALAAAGLGEGEWETFASSWDRLEADRFMADGGRYRRRRHGVFALRANHDGAAIERLTDRPHHQAVEHNRLNGGVDRWFAPLEAAVADGAALRAVFRVALSVFDAATSRVGGSRTGWLTEVHQFRIEATDGEAGQPTPEGPHRDGVDWVLVMMIGRHGIRAGETSVLDASSLRRLGSFTLRAPREMVLVDDARCLHGVTAVEPAERGRPGHRDVLVVTLRADQGGARGARA